VVLDSAFDLAAHPASRVIAVRPVARLEDALDTFHPGCPRLASPPNLVASSSAIASALAG